MEESSKTGTKSPKKDKEKEEENENELIRRIFILARKDYKVVDTLAQEMGFGIKGHSGVIRYIIRDWLKL